MDSRFGGRNCMPFGHDQILFLDIWHNDELLSYSTTLKMTTSFQVIIDTTVLLYDVYIVGLSCNI